MRRSIKVKKHLKIVMVLWYASNQKNWMWTAFWRFKKPHNIEVNRKNLQSVKWDQVLNNIYSCSWCFLFLFLFPDWPFMQLISAEHESQVWISPFPKPTFVCRSHVVDASTNSVGIEDLYGPIMLQSIRSIWVLWIIFFTCHKVLFALR
jgi:hypothetical protein